jgi:branched-subunit amino acid transport protein
MIPTDGLIGFALILAVGFAVHEPWRWLGLYFGQSIDPESEAFRWVRAVSNALVAALVSRLLMFPTGALEAVPLWQRLAATMAGFVVFCGLRQHLGAGILAGGVILLALIQLQS